MHLVVAQAAECAARADLELVLKHKVRSLAAQLNGAFQ